jgi:hypothetical protein
VDEQMAEEEEKSGLSRQAFTSEKEPEVLQAGWLHEKASYKFPTPAFFGVSGTVLGGMEQSVLSHAAHIRNSRCQSGRNVSGGCNGMSICEIVNASDIG